MASHDKDNQLYKQAIALAGLFQAVYLADQIANQGRCGEESLATSLRSVTAIDPPSIESIYGGDVNYLPGLSSGFSCLAAALKDQRKIQPHILRYIMGLLHLQKQLQRSDERLQIMRTRLAQVKEQERHYDDVDQLSSRLAGIYEDTISTFDYRIHINGNRLYLENPVNVKRIRALLFSGIRAALLWRQVGGRRWRLLLQRKQLLNTVQSLN